MKEKSLSEIGHSLSEIGHLTIAVAEVITFGSPCILNSLGVIPLIRESPGRSDSEYIANHARNDLYLEV